MNNAPPNIKKQIAQLCDQVIGSFEYILKNPKEILSYTIDCSLLHPKFLEQDVRHSTEFSNMFNELIANDAPCVYWFEILNGPSTATIHQRISTYKETAVRVVPALKPLNDSSSKILYVGKSTVGFWGRLITHMGYLSGKATSQGLQLDYWAKDLRLELRVNILQFPEAMADYLSIVEFALAKNLQPIIGKHKR